MKRLVVVLSILGLVMGFTGHARALIITEADAVALANALLGSGMIMTNVNYTGANLASGLFTGGTAAGIGIESGIVLTTGVAANLNGTSNTGENISFNNELPGDLILDALIPGYATYDATILEFDFTAVSGGSYDVYFQYVFGSDEYNEYVAQQYNDVFGFFLDGTNIALVPGTTNPVSINNVNNSSYPAYYHDNSSGSSAFEYDGFTAVLSASFLNLEGTHHMKLAIADAGDFFWDSGVFLKAESFSVNPPDVIPEPSTLFLLGTGVIGLVVMGRKHLLKK